MTDLPRTPRSEPRGSTGVPRVHSFVPAGWDEPVADALVALLEVERSTGVALRIAQIKENLGGLRIYVDIDEVSAGALRVEEAAGAVPANLPPHRPHRAELPQWVPQVRLAAPAQERVIRGTASG